MPKALEAWHLAHNTGREAIRLETQELTTVYEGTLERIGTWAKGAWTIDLSRANG